MRALLNLFKQDALLSWRNGLVLVTVITLVTIVALYWTLPFFLSDEIEFGPSRIFLDQTEGRVFRSLLQETEFAADRDELEAAVAEGTGLVGIVASGAGTALNFELVYKHVPDEAQVNILKAGVGEIAAAAAGVNRGTALALETLHPDSPTLRANHTLVMIMLTFEVMILGFLFVAVVVFGEKKEGSIRAYRVTPSGLTNYVVSKVAVFTVLSTIYGLVLVAVTTGPARLAQILPVLLLSTALMTTLGLGVAVFFQNISQWFVPGVIILALNMLAVLPYQIPTFSAPWLTWLPGYAVIFGATEILFPSGKTGFLGSTYLTLGIWLALAVPFAFWAVRRNLLRET